MISFIFNELNNLLIHLIVIITFELIFYYTYIKPSIRKGIVNSIIKLNFEKTEKDQIETVIKKIASKNDVMNYLNYMNNIESNFYKINNKNISYIAVILLIILISSTVIVNIIRMYFNIKLTINSVKIISSFITLITMEMLYIFILNSKKKVNSNTFFIDLISSFINNLDSDR